LHKKLYYVSLYHTILIMSIYVALLIEKNDDFYRFTDGSRGMLIKGKISGDFLFLILRL